MKRNLLIILIITSGVFGAEHIRPSEDQETDVNRKEGEPVILKCSYDSSSDYVSLYWYRQYPNRALQYLLYRDSILTELYSIYLIEGLDQGVVVTLQTEDLSLLQPEYPLNSEQEN
ncbi:hypothetical protein SRHO_G00019890 [Serrasalmus rhombeus]